MIVYTYTESNVIVSFKKIPAGTWVTGQNLRQRNKTNGGTGGNDRVNVCYDIITNILGGRRCRYHQLKISQHQAEKKSKEVKYLLQLNLELLNLLD